MNFKKTGLALAFGMVASMGASALDVVQTGGAGADNWSVKRTAANLKNVTTNTVIGTITSANTVVAFEAGDIITVTVAGAKFDRTNLGASPVALGGAGAATITSTTLDVATDTILTVTVNGASTNTNLTDTITLTGAYDLTGVSAGTDVTVKMTVARDVLGVNQVVHKSVLADYIDLKTTASALSMAAPTAGSDTATVASSFVNFDASSTSATTMTVADTAVVVQTPADNNTSNAATTGTQLIKMTGIPTAVTKIVFSAPTGITQVTSAGVAPTTATAGSTLFLDGQGNAYGLIGNTQTQAGLAKQNAVFTVDGTTAISPSTVTYGVEYLAGTSDQFVSHTVLADTTVGTVIRNGSAFTVNTTGPLNTIKVTDMSGSLTASTGSISVTGYDAAGASVSGSVTVPALASNGTVTVTGSDLIAGYPDAIRFDFVVESTEIIASNVKKATTGTTVTTYRNATENVTTGKAGNGAL